VLASETKVKDERRKVKARAAAADAAGCLAQKCHAAKEAGGYPNHDFLDRIPLGVFATWREVSSDSG
jgi:hypothetical protein